MLQTATVKRLATATVMVLPVGSGRTAVSEDAGTRPLLDWIEDYRRRHGWNYSEFARAAGVDHSILSRWLQGTRRPRPEVLHRMAERLGADADELLHLAGYRARRGEDTAEVAMLTAKLRQVRMTPDRYRLLGSLLDEMRRGDD